jgi:hypothetical protein
VAINGAVTSILVFIIDWRAINANAELKAKRFSKQITQQNPLK